MFKSSTEGVNSLTVDDVARQAVTESGTSSVESSIANSQQVLIAGNDDGMFMTRSLNVTLKTTERCI